MDPETPPGENRCSKCHRAGVERFKVSLATLFTAGSENRHQTVNTGHEQLYQGDVLVLIER